MTIWWMGVCEIMVTSPVTPHPRGVGARWEDHSSQGAGGCWPSVKVPRDLGRALETAVVIKLMCHRMARASWGKSASVRACLLKEGVQAVVWGQLWGAPRALWGFKSRNDTVGFNVGKVFPVARPGEAG